MIEVFELISFWLTEGDTGIRVEGFMGSISPAGGMKVADIAVATIEKANGIVNR